MKRLLVIGIILMFLFCNVSFTTLSDENSRNLSGKILYVGGSGPGNYTEIQDAIDNASDGDTVFVYNGIYSISNEGFIFINNSLELRGESRDETIITSNNYSILYINTNNVGISDFTFEGFLIGGGPANITETSRYNNIEIINNRINSPIGLLIIGFINVTVKGNIISAHRGEDYYGFGIISLSNSKVKIEYNEVSGFENGLWIGEGSSVKNNLFRDNEIGITLYADGSSSQQCIISKNNFIQNRIHSTFGLHYLSIISKYFSSKSDKNPIKKYMSKDVFNPTNKNLLTNIKWDGNYWDNWIGIGPKFIFGFINLGIPFFGFLPMINFDWHPAKEPYDFYEPESASVTVSGTNKMIKILLTKGGDNAPYINESGSNGFDIFINGTKIPHINFGVGTYWEVGECIILTENENNIPFVPGTEYSLTVAIMDNVIYDAYITVLL